MKPATKRGIDEYRDHGYDPGTFLTAVLCNDLRESFGRADAQNAADLYEIVRYCWNHLPAICWGNPAAVKEWLKTKKLQRDLAAECPPPPWDTKPAGRFAQGSGA